jgi:alkanesulfonate monooxygenase SsuD/methylene tetrahydromethanopterin reductase-like flavin-dependent oxidoreductase (luciferase family)
VTFDGAHYRYEGVRLQPTPVQRPIPAWFCGGTSRRAAERAGRAGLPYWLANCSYEQAELVVKEYRRAGAEAGHPDERLKVACFKDVCIGDSIPEAQALRQMWMDNFYEEHILGYGYLVDDDGRHVYNPPAEHPVRKRFVDSIFCGTVEMVTEELRRYERLGCEAVLIATTQRELLAERVLPEFR